MMKNNTYRLFGYHVRSMLPLPISCGCCTFGTERGIDLISRDDKYTLPKVKPIFHLNAAKYAPNGFGVWRVDGGYLFRYKQIADFHISINNREITCHMENGVRMETIWALISGSILAFVSTLDGGLCLHASAVEIAGKAVGFLAFWGGGKSTTAAYLVNRGYPLLSDDIIVVRPGESLLAEPAYPRMKMRPDMVRCWGGDPNSLPRVVLDDDKVWQPVGNGWGRFAKKPLPLERVYLLDLPQEDEVQIESVSKQEAAIAFITHLFQGRLLKHVLGDTHVLNATEAAVRCNVRRLRFPRTLDALAEVENKICVDLQAPSTKSQNPLMPIASVCRNSV